MFSNFSFRSWPLLLIVLVTTGCHFKTPADWNKERFDRDVAEIRAGKTDSLHFYDVHETDTLLKSIAGMRGVKQVSFESMNDDLTDAGYQVVAELPDLTELTFYHIDVPDKLLGLFLRSTKLEKLEIWLETTPQFQMATVIALPSLRSLRLDLETSPNEALATEQWVDQALEELRQAKSLTKLIVVGRVFVDRKATLARLQQELPHCEITLHASSRKDDGPRIPLE